jgi:hypothetical protein
LEQEIDRSIDLIATELRVQRNADRRKLRDLSSAVAICFGVIARYDRPAKFQPEAVRLRDAFASCAAAIEPNEEVSIETWHLLSALVQLWKGAAINLPASEKAHGPFGVSEIPFMMRRIQTCIRPENLARRGLEYWTATADKFQAGRAAVIHEAEMLAMLARVLRDADAFEFANDETFATFAKELETAAVGIVNAGQSGNHATALSSMAQLRKACATCHASFR